MQNATETVPANFETEPRPPDEVKSPPAKHNNSEHDNHMPAGAKLMLQHISSQADLYAQHDAISDKSLKKWSKLSTMHLDRASWRLALGHWLENQRVILSVVLFLTLDVLMYQQHHYFVPANVLLCCSSVFLELLVLDGVFGDPHSHKVEQLSEVLHYISLGILALFQLEVLLHLLAFGRHLFKHIGYIADFIIVPVSIALEVLFHGVGSVLVVLRLWRVVRLMHSVYAVHHEETEKRYRLMRTDLKHLQDEYHKLAVLCARLQHQLHEYQRKDTQQDAASSADPAAETKADSGATSSKR